MEALVSLIPSETFARMLSRNAVKQLASATLRAGKAAAKDIGMKVNDVSKTVAIDAGKKLVEKAIRKLSTSGKCYGSTRRRDY